MTATSTASTTPKHAKDTQQAQKQAVLYRMVTPEHVCPYGVQARKLLDLRGYAVEDHELRSREETDAFKASHDVETTPQVFIGGERVGGYDELQRFLSRA